MIDLSRVCAVLADADALIESLDGRDLDESDAIGSQSKGLARQERARLSQDLSLLADRLEYAASLVRVEYWQARGKEDPTGRPYRRRDA
jgi:hypothetical protein